MRLLVLGGSWFYGCAVVQAAIARGWETTTFRRGISGHDVDGVRAATGDRSSNADLRRLAATGPWDVVVDASGYVPANVSSVARVLEPVCGRYVFMSTVSVYRDWPGAAVSEASVVKECAADQQAADGGIGDPGPA